MNKLTEREALDYIHKFISLGKIGPFGDLKLWIYENIPTMSAGAWSELRTLLKDAYELTDIQLATEFAACRSQEEVDDFTPLVNELDIRGFVRTGMDFTSGLESPNAFGFWSYLTILAAALRRQVYVDMGYFKIWPTMQTLIVAPSQKGSKTTIADFITQIGEDSGRINFLMDEGTQEGLKKQLQLLTEKEGEAVGLIYVPEMSAMFGEKDYNSDLVKNLTDLFDSRSKKLRLTVSHGEQLIKNMAISALMCSNEKWLRESVPPSSFEGGWWARVLPIWCRGTDKIVPIPTLSKPGIRETLVTDLKRTALVKGAAKLDSKANDYYTERYIQMKKDFPEDERMHPFWTKFPVHMLRIAMLLSISEDLSQRDEIGITYKHIYQSDRLLSWVLNRLPGLYSVLGTTKYGDDAIFVKQYIKGKGGRVNEKTLGRAMLRRMPGYTLKKILQDFKEYGMIVYRPTETIDGGYDIVLLNEEEN